MAALRAGLPVPQGFLRRDLACRAAPLICMTKGTFSNLAQKYGASVQALMFRLQYLWYIEG
jgi:hypothetical protein